MEILTTPPPKPRGPYTPRVTEAMKRLQSGQSVLVDKPTAACLAAWFRNRGFKTTRRTSGEAVQLWVLEGGQ